jgi:pimeloyl-ACP methyl ester carboxylesterase
VVQKYLESHTAPAAVLLAAVPPRGVIRVVLAIALRHPLAFIRANLTLSLYPLVNTPRLAQELFFAADMPEERVATHFARLQDESYCAFLGMLALELPRPRRVKTPMLVLGAAQDTIFSTGEVEATARAYGTQAQVFDMAHDMMLEAGWQDVADRIVSWLEERGL